MDTARKDAQRAEPTLGLWDAVSLIVGIIIGVGIFRTPAEVFEHVPDFWSALGVWVLGGFIALIGAFCFAELAAAYPRSGGEYVYLSRACGPLTGYLFAWAQLTIIRPGSIAMLAYVFADYAGRFLGIGNDAVVALACLSIVALTAVNVLGVTLGTLTQNVLTIAKVLGLVAVVGVGLWQGEPANLAPNPRPVYPDWLPLVMMSVFWTYSGWQEAAYVVSEIKDRRRNIPRALLLGTAAVIVIYLVVNAAYLYGLGFDAFHGPGGALFAAHLLGKALPEYGERAMAILVMISALGAINGMIFTTARIYSEFGTDHRLFAPLSHWSRRYGTPVRALLVQGAITLLLMAGVAVYGGNEDSFGTMLDFTSAVFWFFFLLTGIAFFILRYTDPDTPRPFRVPAYPVLPLIFCAMCAYMTIGVIRAKPSESFTGLGILVIGLPFYFWREGQRRPPSAKPAEPVPHEMVP
jgi:amino acid transporter